AVGPDDGRHPEPARGLDPHRHHAVRSRPSLFALTDHAIASANLVYADRLGRGAVHAAGSGRLVLAFGDGVGARRGDAVVAFRRRAYRGSNQASLPSDSG